MKSARSNVMTPIPHTAGFEDLNAMPTDRCRQRQDEIAGRHAETISERLVADLAAFWELPAVALKLCESQAVRVSFTALVRYRCNDNLVPTAFGLRNVWAKALVDEVVILNWQIREHSRSYDDSGIL